jgi:L-ascorbate metabolism protein UlaG (beta-lactamase superfamily)
VTDRTAITITRRGFFRTAAAVTLSTPILGAGQARRARLRLIRHATLVVQYAGKTLLVDPLLADAGTLPPINRTANQRPNPLVPLPVPAASVLAGIDAVLVTHTHSDHWDAVAAKQLAPATLVFVQPPDVRRLGEQGFSNLRPIDTETTWEGIRITRCGAEHGRGEVGQRMAPVSGFVLTAAGWPTVYITGDTVWCPEVARVIQAHEPGVIVVNAGAAQFLEGGPITMDAADVLKVCEAAPAATVVAVHMEAINHCLLTRPELQQALDQSRPRVRVLIPRDGETVELA